MATTAQILANRNNARKSTGPKMDEDKASVSQNAVKHGQFAESVIKGENEADYEALSRQNARRACPRRGCGIHVSRAGCQPLVAADTC
jgi:hypothetical protein